MQYKHFSREERFYIEQRLYLGDSVPKIAKDLGRNKTSVYREIARNTDGLFGFYSGLRAHNIAAERQAHAVRKGKFFDSINPEAMELIESEFKVRSSPEQIAFKIADELQIKVSHQTIYRYIHANRANGGNLYLHLRRRGKKYRNKSTTTEKIKDKQSIEKRCSIDILAKEAGHYEIDTIYGLEQKSFLLTMVDIATKYTLIVMLLNKEAQTIYDAIMQVMATTLLPFKSITSDNGSEFAYHAEVAKNTDIEWYFCHPYSSFERGLNENTNGLARDFYPKRTDFRDIQEAEFLKLQNILNNRPRKTLGYLTPTQAMMQHVMNH